MKTNLTGIAAILLMAILSLSSCTKYEDGPLISLRTKTARLTGKWEVVEEKVNGSTQPEDNTPSIYEFDKDLDYKESHTGNGVTVISEGKWDFADKKEKIRITYDNDDVEEFTILRLTNNELWVEQKRESIGGDTDIHTYKMEKE